MTHPEYLRVYRGFVDLQSIALQRSEDCVIVTKVSGQNKRDRYVYCD